MDPSKESEEKIEIEKKNQGYGFGYRHVQAFLVSIFLAIAFILRSYASVAVVAMTDKTRNNTNIEIFDWNKQTQDYILSSFFFGYTIMQLPVGYLAERFGTKPLYTIALMVNGCVSLMIPWVVHWGGWMAMCACRALQGISQSCVYPGVMVLASRWIPNHERSRLTNLMFSGLIVGTIAGMSVSSFLSSTEYGWPSMFYVIGVVTLVFGVIWIFFAASDPSSHKYISEEEIEFIYRNINFSRTQKKRKLPLKEIMTCIPIYAMFLTQFGCVWGSNTIMLEMPSYMNKVLGINMRQSGIVLALPFIGMWVWSIIGSFLSDWIINSNLCSRTNSRRIFNSLGTFVPGVLLIVMTYIPQEYKYIIIGFFTLLTSFFSSINMGFKLSFVDIAPNLSGTIMGITNFVSQGLGVFAPLVVGAIVTNESDPSQWQIVFFITSALLIVTNAFYVIYITTKVQPWNYVEDSCETGENTLKSAEEENMIKKEKIVV